VFAGIYTMLSLGDLATLHLASIAISVYLICFGCVLCVFEIRIGMFETMVRKRAGFMFTYIGRTLFLFFLATFCFPREQLTTYVVGGFTLANCALNIFVMWKHGEMYGDPTGKYSTAEQSGVQYVQDNPDLTRAAVSRATNYARENPDAARAGVQYAAQNNAAASNPFAVGRT